MRSLILICVLLTGCATAAERQGRQIQDGLTSADQALNVCLAPLNSDPKYADLEKHVPLADIRKATLEQMTDKSLANQHEIALYSDRHKDLEVCRSVYVAQVSSIVPAFGPIYNEYFDQSDENLIKLIQQKETWGEYLVNAKAITEAVYSKRVAVAQQVNAELNAAYRQELANRAAAAAAFSNAMYQQQQMQQQQQIINNMNRPVNTNCNRFGNSVNCTTY